MSKKKKKYRQCDASYIQYGFISSKNNSLLPLSYLLDATDKCIDETRQTFHTPHKVSSLIGEQTNRMIRSSQLMCLFFVVKIEMIPHRTRQCFRTHRVVQYCAFDCQTRPTSYHYLGPHQAHNHGGI